MDSVWKASGLWILFFVLFCFETVVGVGVGSGTLRRGDKETNGVSKVFLLVFA